MATSAFSNNAGPSHSIQISHKRPRISSTSSNTCQGFSSRPWEPLFNSLQFPHLLKQLLNRITDSQIQDFSMRVLRSPASTLYFSLSKRKQQQTKNNVSIKGLSFRRGDWGGQPQRGTGMFWRGNRGHFGVDMAWNWINKWRNPLFVSWVQRSRRMARGVATMRDPSKP